MQDATEDPRCAGPDPPPPHDRLLAADVDDAEQHGEGHANRHKYPHPLTRQRSMETLFHPYTDKQTRLRARFRQTIEFPISSMILMNSRALAQVRRKIPALQGIHWPHIRFLTDHPQWHLGRHQHNQHEQPHDSPAPTGWALMTPANRILVLSCCLSWCGFYICRSHVSVLLPIISQETGLSLSLFSTVFSAGLITTALGKVLNGMLADRYGGQVMFAFYLLFAILTTVLMSLSPTVADVGTLPVLGFWAVVWCLNRWFHSGAWGAMILLLSVQLPQRAYGRSLSIVSLGYSGGDMLARLAYGLMLSHGLAWNQAFLIGALMSTFCSIPSLLLWARPLFRKRTKMMTTTTTKSASPPKTPEKKAAAGDRISTKEIVLALARDRAFVVMTVSYAVMAVLREIIFTWTTVFLVEAVDTDSGTASTISLFIPFCMVASANTTGYVADHVEGSNRVRLLQFIPALVVLASCVALTALMTVLRDAAPGFVIVLLLIAMCYFGELHNAFIEGFQFVALSASVNRPATVSGLIAFCSNFSSTASSLAVGAILGVSADARAAWILIYDVMCVCAAITAVASLVSLRLSQPDMAAAATAAADHDDVRVVIGKESSSDSLAIGSTTAAANNQS